MSLQLLIIVVALLGPILYSTLRYKRFKQYSYFPQLPPSFLLGHLKTINDLMRSGKPMAHPDQAFDTMHEALGRPAVMFLDFRPINPPMLVVTSHEVAEQVSKISKDFPYSVPKRAEGYDHFIHLTGPTSILRVNDESWKSLRKRFNPGFSTQHLLTFLPSILDKCLPFLDHLDRLAECGQASPLISYTGNLTFDIITSVTMGLDFNAQGTGEQDPFMSTYRQLLDTYATDELDLPWFFKPRLEWNRRRLSNRIQNTLKGIIQGSSVKRRERAISSRSVLALALPTDRETLSQREVDEACDQLNSFLLAGHDTTSILLCWMFYELSRSPHALQALRQELDELFGPDPNPSAVRDKLLSPNGQDFLSRMTYASAIIKETLRLWPPASTVRALAPGTSMEAQTPQGNFSLKGVTIYHLNSRIHRDPDVYGETANDFVPERWLGEDAEKIPVSAWRPFERGPRNCIGQELANIEARVVLALVARRYDFIKVGLGSLSRNESGEHILDTNGRFKVDSEVYMTRHLTAKPVDGMTMRVKIRAHGG